MCVNPTVQLKECDLKADTPSSVDQSPAALGKGRGKGQRRPRKPKGGAAGQPQVGAMAPQQVAMQGVPAAQMGHMGGVYGQGMQQAQQFGAGNAGQQQQWYGQQQQAPQQGYYPPQMANGECCGVLECLSLFLCESRSFT